MYLTNRELANIYGGSISASLLNALSRGVSTLYDIGYALGSAIRKLLNGRVCKVK